MEVNYGRRYGLSKSTNSKKPTPIMECSQQQPPTATQRETAKGENGRKSKLGRKGDPRMHAAVVARSEDPKLGLRDALERGGFVFFREPNGNVVDTDNIALSQRKNQLSRRLRMLKQNPCKESDECDVCEDISNTNFSSAQGQNGNGETLEKNVPETKNVFPILNSKKRKMPQSDPKLDVALSQFRGDMSSLLKNSMIKAGYENYQTDECDEAYLLFAEIALEEEMSRISRIKK
eukprot:13181729-Ditylum_brightwellii.AAC.1